MINVKPRSGLRVPNPETGRPLPDDGMPVADSSYWRRRIADGAVEISEVQAAHPPRAASRPVEPEKTETPTSEEGDKK